MNRKPFRRHVEHALVARMDAMPAVVVSGARQTGKSTLASELTPGKRRLHSLDDLDVLDLARKDPDALVGGATPVTLDEVQRAPDLLLAVKRAIDRRRRRACRIALLANDHRRRSRFRDRKRRAGAADRDQGVEPAAYPRHRAPARISFQYGKSARAGLLLHTGTTLEWLTPDVLAAPWWRVV